MITIKRTDSDNLDFQKLVKELDIDLSAYYKEEKSFYGTLNAIDKVKYVILAFDKEDNLVGCGGIKPYSKDNMEIKRMYVPSVFRGKGIASIILKELEHWSIELNFKACVLETLKQKPYAIKFYEKNNYEQIPNFGDYIKTENSICFQKKLLK